LFMLLSISDLDQISNPQKLVKRQAAPEKEYDVINIELVPNDAMKPVSMSPGSEKRYREETVTEESEKPVGEEKPLPISADIIVIEPADKYFADETKTIDGRAAELVDRAEDERKPLPFSNDELLYAPLETKTAGVSDMENSSYARSAKAKIEEKSDDDKRQFSILPNPITQAAPESVNIGAMYITDEAVPIVSQHTQASLHEVLVDSGMIQAVETPKSILITVEKMPTPLNVVTPEYPVWATKRGASGAVWVKAQIDTDGNILEAFVLSSSNPGYGFEEAALEAAKKSKYNPAESNGLKIPVWIVFPVKFIYKSE